MSIPEVNFKERLFMNFAELVRISGLTQSEVATILDISPVSVSKRVNNKNSEVKENEIRKLENATGKQIYFNENIAKNREYDQVAINYLQISGVSESILKSPLVKERVQFDKEIVGIWRRNPETQRIVKMRGDKMDAGDYPLRDGDILIVDTSERDVANSGMYIYTTDLLTGREVFISNINIRPDGNYRLSYFNDKYEDIIYTSKQIKEMNFIVWGRIIKNLSLIR